MNTAGNLLIVEDERVALLNLQQMMKKEGYSVTISQSGSNALKLLGGDTFDVVLTDLKMGDVDGMQILRKCKSHYPGTEVIIMTGYSTLDMAITTIKEGAYYYISKPIRPEEVRKVVKEAMEKVLLKQKNNQLKEQIENITGRRRIITQNRSIEEILKTARRAAPTDCNVLIIGESGTGKELFARFIHKNSTRNAGPFVGLNCSTLTGELLANELFGHERGAFTGATAVKKGLMEIAEGGTLFLDEITEMPPAMQANLLRAVQEREILRIGGTEPVKIDARFIAATNRDLTSSIKNGDFRQDLYYRLNVVTLNLPPLCERKDDIALLSYYFLKKYTSLFKKDIKEISQGAIDVLMEYDFPGNVRELENIIERGVIMANGDILQEHHLPEDIRSLTIKTFRKKQGRILTLEEHETAYIKWVLNELNGNKTTTAEALGLDRVSLWRKLKKYELSDSAE
ncbi:sigma-54-dependent transcriptional regulator [Candidatus Magnetomonas plexicatena]|uniref:sigma-54-dependent transcriptional regulator n=1 Tax=Candidatus Magnetomonas plexicatena TaxID=2552947 RepID=UPI001C782208|nr:sigma-54-dependent Fis family transcriptional regulator [Nitrospirales bacterium LBB_01]